MFFISVHAHANGKKEQYINIDRLPPFLLLENRLMRLVVNTEVSFFFCVIDLFVCRLQVNVNHFYLYDYVQQLV